MAVAVDSTTEIDTDLHHNAVNILLAIYDAEDQTATTSQIGTVTGLSSANISGNHAQKLERQDLIKRAGEVESNAPINTNVYTITHRGRKEAKRLLKQTDAETPMSEGEKLALLHDLKEHREMLTQQSEPGTTTNDELKERVEELESQQTSSEPNGGDSRDVEELRQEIEELRERVGKNNSRIEAAHKLLKKLPRDLFGR